jgi:hypothetical protein
MTEPTPEQRAKRKRLRDDFEYWAKHCCKIRSKDQEMRFVVLKARQQGLSTVISAFQYWWLSQHKAQKGLVMAHEGESTSDAVRHVPAYPRQRP